MNYRTERYPVVTLSLIGINTLVWLVSLICEIVSQGDSQDWIFEHLWLVPATSYPWMYLTHQFVHANFLHLFGNMIFLFLFGSCVEDMIGRLRFIIFYLLSGLVAALVFIAMTPAHFTSTHPMGGASGAISGCMGMYVMLRAGAKIEFAYYIWFFYGKGGTFEVPAWVAISFWFAKDLLLAVVSMNSHRPGGGVAFAAHVGGMIGGFALVAAYRWRVRPRQQAIEEAKPILDPAKVMTAFTPPPLPGATPGETPTIYLHDGAAQTGPFTLTQVQDMLQHGTISREAVYWSDGMEQWQAVAELSATPM
ncbi:MAG: rhomboid family intramembrane serine protease [Verrucomicrobia bacterium]|nr:rhomboid family intramembrane serine protease [Verrucomicrobiota bacterium]